MFFYLFYSPGQTDSESFSTSVTQPEIERNQLTNEITSEKPTCSNQTIPGQSM